MSTRRSTFDAIDQAKRRMTAAQRDHDDDAIDDHDDEVGDELAERERTDEADMQETFAAIDFAQQQKAI